MKKIIVFLFVILFDRSFAQCDLDENRYDDFKKVWKKSIKFDLNQSMFGESAAINFRKIGSTYLIEFTNHTIGTVSKVVAEGAELLFMLENDSIITLNAIEIATGNWTGKVTVLTANYGITEDDLKLLQNSPVKKYRFYLTDSYIEKEIKDIKKPKIMQAASCMLQ